MYSSSFHGRDPGARVRQRKHVHTCPTFPEDAKILDIGCGSGAQTRDLTSTFYRHHNRCG